MTVKDWINRVPWMLVAVSISLMLIGLSGIDRGDELSKAGDLFSRQTIWIMLSIPAIILASFVPYRRLRAFSYPAFAVSLLLLLAVYFFPAKGGSHRWIPLGFMDFQPSELTKLTYILSLAHYLMYRSNYRRLTGLVVPFVLTMVPVALILREPDLGTSLLFVPMLFAMLFAAGAKLKHLSAIVALGVLMLPVLWLGMSAEQKSRVVTLFTQSDSGPAPKGDGYHLHQSKQVLSLGGVWGSEVAGMAFSDPAAYHLPAGRTDFIFSLVGERWGLVGTTVVLLLYAVFFAMGLRIAAGTREPFGRLIAVGIVALLGAQTVINTGMTVGLMPITGMTLPLMSYGGSSLLATSIAIGLLINIAVRPGYEVGNDPFRFAANS